MLRIQGTFLAGRAQRRIFWTLLLAAAVPLAMFGVAMHTLLSANFQSQAGRQQVQLTKFAGMGLLDRLLVARTALDIVVRTDRVAPDTTTDNRRGRVLKEVVQVDARGQAVVGSVSLAQRWRNHAAMPQARHPHRDAAALLLGDFDPATGTAPVLIALPDDALADHLWVAEVEPAFLFSELSVDASGSRICVFESPRRPVSCPGWTADEETALQTDTRADGTAPLRWELFLRSDFDVGTWTLVSTEAPTGDTTEAGPLARLSVLVALATLLFVGMLGLIQVRRTMVPLERLIAGTRRLSERDYDARVQIRPGDEFGELATSFNHMAERIGHQMQALQVQSSIDHEILNGLNVGRVLQRVAQRLEQVVPGAAACVIELDRGSRMLARVHTAQAPMSLISLPRNDAIDLSQQLGNEDEPCVAPPPWLLAILRGPVHTVWLRCARANNELLGLLAIGTHQEALDTTEKRREVAELCDRVSVALSSADRERRLLERATHDSLTGLVNRAGLYESIDERLASEPHATFSVLFVDLDRFKEVNDSMGHQAGDDLLRVVSERLQQIVPAGTLVARPGGDEFVLVAHGARGAADELARSLCLELSAPIELHGRMAVVGASIGIALHPEHGKTSADLMRRADLAMYSAKARGGGVAACFEPALDARVAERAALLGDLRQALARGEFELHYQPRVHARSGRTTSAEALLRWRHPQRGLVPAPMFIPLLEETGLIDGVGMWVIEQALDQLSRWRAQGLALDSIAVNVSTRQLWATNLSDQVKALLARLTLRPGNLELEVTESIFMGDATVAIRTLRQLHDNGISIALDDFGTGYSSLSYLHKLPIEVLKIDRSFVEELGRRDSALALARSIVALARALHLRVVAEGIETQQQAEVLAELGCDELQGYLYAPALDPAAFSDFVRQRVRRPRTAVA